MKNINLISTDKPSRLLIDTIENKLYYQPILHNKTVNVLTQHIYITSNEEIKMDDWYLDDTNSVRQAITECESYWTHRKKYQKIILTTDQDLIKDGVQAIDDEFLEWFVKNPSCEEVEVDKQKEILGEVAGTTYIDFNYKIIIPIEEPKQETLKEAAEIEKIAMDKLKSKWEHLYTFGYPKRPFPTNYENDLNNVKAGLYEGAKWQQEQDKNKYSEEEVRNLFRNYQYNLAQWVLRMEDDIDGKPIPTEWFEQFKKK